MVLSIIGLILAILIGLFILELAIVALFPGFSAPKQRLETQPQMSKGIDEGSSRLRQDVSFTVDGTAVNAWLYLPNKYALPCACVVMAHGFGGTRKNGLEPYAVRFLTAGYAVLIFDYRYFGDSDGQPRQLIWIPDQLKDWQAAIDYARSRQEIDRRKIALWGTSFSGGHVIVTAAKDHGIRCVSAQCPGLDGRASARMAFQKQGFNFRLMLHGQRDLVRSWLGFSPHKIPIVGNPGNIACLTAEDAYDGYAELVSDDFINEACARIVIRADKYRPVSYARNVRCPVLLQICEHDSLTPGSAAEETVKQLGEYAEPIYYPIGHFDIYHGQNFEKSVNDQLNFFKKHLNAKPVEAG
ncbi:MAG: alpha/beta fold hydrolase [Desulfobacterales bacterium]|jgi:dienelactone hydrolase